MADEAAPTARASWFETLLDAAAGYTNAERDHELALARVAAGTVAPPPATGDVPPPAGGPAPDTFKLAGMTFNTSVAAAAVAGLVLYLATRGR